MHVWYRYMHVRLVLTVRACTFFDNLFISVGLFVCGGFLFVAIFSWMISSVYGLLFSVWLLLLF